MTNHILNSCGVAFAPSPTVINENNGGCTAQIQSGYVKSNMTKHISPKLFHTHELQNKGEIMVTHVRSCDHHTDMFTKALSSHTLENCRHGISMWRLREVLGTREECP